MKYTFGWRDDPFQPRSSLLRRIGYSRMGSGVPLLNEYKQEFLWKRLPQTILGGPKLRLGYDAPCYVYFNQILIFIIPCLFNAILTPMVNYAIIPFEIGLVVISSLAFLFVLISNCTSAYIKRKRAAVASVTRNAQNILAEEDEIEFTSCLEVEAITFVIPGKKYSVNIILHSLFSAVLIGLGFGYLLPRFLNDLYASLAASIVLHFLGWFTLCVAQYSLSVGGPPEPATYQTDDPYELTPLMRPFYCVLCFVIDILHRYYSSDLLLTNQILHVLFVLLPLLWTLGVLPPMEAFFAWLIEQTTVILFGGSPMASHLRSIMMLLVSVGLFVAIYLIPYGIVTVCLMASSGYLLSIDLSLLANQIWRLFCQIKTSNKQVFPQHGADFLWHWSFSECIFHLAVLALVGVGAGCLYYFLSPTYSAFSIYLLYGCMALLLLDSLLKDLQSVYVLFGLWRNRLFPKSVQRSTIFHKGKSRLVFIGFIRRALIKFVAPCVMVVYLSMTLSFTNISNPLSPSANNHTSSNATTAFMFILGATRAYRWVWQNTCCALMDFSVYHILLLSLPTSSRWRDLSWSFQLLLISLARDRLLQLLHKLYFFFTLILTSWTDKKQRRPSTLPTITLNLLLFPLVLALICLASVLSAPMLPLFTLPVFFVGYPRTLRSWPGAVGASANTCPDTVFYEHMSLPLSKALRKAYANGSIGEPIVGRHYLARFQDRLIWIQILESGYLYTCVSIKGLELQETSCHTVEAARIDDIFELTFENERSVSCCSWNIEPLNVLRPNDAAYIKTYSDARNQLTGVLDSPDSIKLVAEGFVQALIWLMLHQCYEKKQRGDFTIITRPNTAKTRPALVRSNSGTHWEQLEEESLKVAEANLTSARMTNNLTNKKSLVPSESWTFEEDLIEAWTDDSPKRSEEKRPLSGKSRPRSGHSRHNSLKSFNDSWASDNESLILEPLELNKRPNLVQGLKQMSSQPGASAIVRDESGFGNVLPPLKEDQLNSDSRHQIGIPCYTNHGQSIDDDDDLRTAVDFGLPATDINQVGKGPDIFVPQSNRGKSDPRTPGQVQISNLNDSLHFATLFSRLVSPPLHWRDTPVTRENLVPLLDKFPKAWYRHVISVIDYCVGDSDGGKVASEIAKDATLEDTYTRIVMACYAVINILGTGVNEVSALGPIHVYKVYTGDVPWSPALSWLQEDPELLNLVIKAYRYGVKLAIDQVLMGEVTSLEELQAYMEEYDQDYYIGVETDPEWSAAILQNKPNIFTLNYVPTQGTFSSRVLSLQDVPVLIGSVSHEAVRGQWANLALELLYMTNDDEERNSIQAHSTILRNLTVQAAAPPLGYPIYASPPISIPTL